MTTTPAAKEETPEQIADRLAKKATQNPCSNPSCCPRTAGVVAEILSALRNERERAAKIADAYIADMRSVPKRTEYGEGCLNAAVYIAAAIRGRTE